MALSTFRRRITTGGNLASFPDRQWSAPTIPVSLGSEGKGITQFPILFKYSVVFVSTWIMVWLTGGARDLQTVPSVRWNVEHQCSVTRKRYNIFQPRFHANFLICINPNDAVTVRGHRYWRWRGDASSVGIGLYWIFNTNQYGNLEFNTLTLYWLVLVCICLYFYLLYVCISLYCIFNTSLYSSVLKPQYKPIQKFGIQYTHAVLACISLY